MRRPSGITFSAIWYFIVAGLCLLGLVSIIFLFPQFREQPLSRTLGMVVLIVLGGAFAIVGWGLWKLSAWARDAAIVLAVLLLPVFPLGTIIGALILWYLLKLGKLPSPPFHRVDWGDLATDLTQLLRQRLSERLGGELGAEIATQTAISQIDIYDPAGGQPPVPPDTPLGALHAELNAELQRKLREEQGIPAVEAQLSVVGELNLGLTYELSPARSLSAASMPTCSDYCWIWNNGLQRWCWRCCDPCA